MCRKLTLIFLLSFLLNFIWENSHSVLFVSHKGGPITQIILLRAALFDAVFITLLSLPFLKTEYLKNKQWLMIVIGIIFSALLEIYGLNTGRWLYSAAMPIIPFIKTGLTPTIQLGILAYATFKIVNSKYLSSS